MGNVGVALGGLASGIAGALNQKHQEEHDAEVKQREFTQRMIEASLASGQLDEEHIPQAFEMLMGLGGPGKKKGKGQSGAPGSNLPPELQNMLQAITATGQQAAAQPSSGPAPEVGFFDRPRYSGNPNVSELPGPVSRPESVQPPQQTPQSNIFVSPQEQAKRALDAHQAQVEAEFKARLQHVDALMGRGMTRRQAMQAMQFNVPPPKITWAPRTRPGSSYPPGTMDDDNRPIDPKLTYMEGTDEDGDKVIRVTTPLASSVVKPPQSATLNGRFAELDALRQSGDAKYRAMDDTALRAEAAKQIGTERVATTNERKARFNQYLKMSDQQFAKNQELQDYMAQSQPLLLEARRLGIDIQKQNLKTAKALAELMTQVPGSSVEGQDPKVVQSQLEEEGMTAEPVAPPKAPAKAPGVGAQGPSADLRQMAQLLDQWKLETDQLKKDELLRQIAILRARIPNPAPKKK